MNTQCVVRLVPHGRLCNTSLRFRGNGYKFNTGAKAVVRCRLSLGNDKFKRFVSKNFVSIVLVGGMSVGLLQPVPGQLAQKYGASKCATAAIFLLSGFSLQDEDLGRACRAWPLGLLGMVSILLLTPLAASLVLRIRLTPKELTTGLALFCCAPTTLSSGVTLAQIAGANSALALALTIASNCLGILTMPYFISVFIARGLGITIPATKLLWSLVHTLLLPLLIGKVMRETLRGFGHLVDISRNRQAIAMLSAVILSTVPWMQISCSRDMLLQLDAASLAACVSLGIGVHLLFLVFNWLLVQLVEQIKGQDTPSARAVVLVASQKTLPVCVAVVDKLAGQLGEAGLLVLPVVLAHFSQIVLDSMLVDLWLRHDDDDDDDDDKQVKDKRQQLI